MGPAARGRQEKIGGVGSHPLRIFFLSGSRMNPLQRSPNAAPSRWPMIALKRKCQLRPQKSGRVSIIGFSMSLLMANRCGSLAVGPTGRQRIPYWGRETATPIRRSNSARKGLISEANVWVSMIPIRSFSKSIHTLVPVEPPCPFNTKRQRAGAIPIFIGPLREGVGGDPKSGSYAREGSLCHLPT